MRGTEICPGIPVDQIKKEQLQTIWGHLFSKNHKFVSLNIASFINRVAFSILPSLPRRFFPIGLGWVFCCLGIFFKYQQKFLDTQICSLISYLTGVFPHARNIVTPCHGQVCNSEEKCCWVKQRKRSMMSLSSEKKIGVKLLENLSLIGTLCSLLILRSRQEQLQWLTLISLITTPTEYMSNFNESRWSICCISVEMILCNYFFQFSSTSR